MTLALVGYFLETIGWRVIGYEPPLEVLDRAWFAPAPASRLAADFVASVLAALSAGLVAARVSGFRSLGYGFGLFVSVGLGLLVLKDWLDPHVPPYTPQPAPLWFDALRAVAMGACIGLGAWLATDPGSDGWEPAS
ncbi:MAG: hypothetical protein AAGI52_00055 [Bacteroidota bacterium]